MAGWDERIAQLRPSFPGGTSGGPMPAGGGPPGPARSCGREDLGTARVMTVDADDAGALRDQLTVQASLDRDITG